MDYMTFRYTFDERVMPESNEEIMEFIMTLIRDVLELTPDYKQWTMGYHTHDAKGRDTHKHFHVHFMGKKKLETYRKSFQRWNTKRGDLRKGTELYSLIHSKEENIRDITGFYRYPFKMVHLDELYWNNYFSDEQEPIQIQLAQEQFEERKRKLLEHEQKLTDKTTTYDKFNKYLGEHEQKPKTKKDVQIQIIEFYQKEKMSMNPKTMQGYVYTYLMQNNLMEKDKFIELMEK